MDDHIVFNERRITPFRNTHIIILESMGGMSKSVWKQYVSLRLWELRWLRITASAFCHQSLGHSANTNYRTALWTDTALQLTLMISMSAKTSVWKCILMRISLLGLNQAKVWLEWGIVRTT